MNRWNKLSHVVLLKNILQYRSFSRGNIPEWIFVFKAYNAADSAGVEYVTLQVGS